MRTFLALTGLALFVASGCSVPEIPELPQEQSVLVTTRPEDHSARPRPRPIPPPSPLRNNRTLRLQAEARSKLKAIEAVPKSKNGYYDFAAFCSKRPMAELLATARACDFVYAKYDAT